MINQFDAENYPDREPASLTIGTRWAWTRSEITEIYPTATYTLKYKLIQQAVNGAEISITASKVSSAHVVEVAKASTENKIAGQYFWKAIVERDSDNEQVVVDEGMVELIAQSGDVRSHVYKVLQAIQDILEEKASKDQLAYTINGRSLSRYSFDELRQLERDYRIRWEDEKKALERKQGRSGHHRVLVKMDA